MPTVRHKPHIGSVGRNIDKWVSMPDDDFQYLTLGLILGLLELKRLKRFTWRTILGLLNIWDYCRVCGTISKTSMIDNLGLRGRKMPETLPPELAPFFLIDAKGRYAPSPAGTQLQSECITFLRRLLLDKKEYYRLLYDRHDKAERKKRQEYKRFFQLPYEEQIRISRAYYAMPNTNPQERKAQKATQKYLRVNYDISPQDLAAFARIHPIAKIQPIDLGARSDEPEPNTQQGTDM